MGQIRQINGVYYIEFHARGLLYSQVAGNSLENAQKLLVQVEQKIAGGEALTIARRIDLPDFFERFLAEAGERAYSPRTIGRFTAVIRHFSAFIEKDLAHLRQLDQLTPAVIEGYKDHLVKTQKVKVVNFSILLIRDILEFGIKLGFINDNPSLHVRLLPWPRMRERRVTARYQLARRLLSQGVSLSKLGQLLKLSDISKGIYYADLIPLSREDVYS
jgi:site-specific recombinase XerD